MDKDSKTKYSALQIARYFVKSSTPKDKLTNLKLQKILYFAQGWHLANFDREPLFGDTIEAWKYGPAIASVYHKYKNYGRLPIDKKDITEAEIEKIDKDTREFLDEVWNVYKKYSGADLVFATHQEKPWIEARGNIEETEGEIDTELMYLSFLKKMK